MIEEVISLVVSRLRPSSGDNLSGFVQDADYALGGMEEAVFSSADVTVSTDPRSLVNARVIVSPAAGSLQSVAEGLQRAVQFMAYAHFYAASVEWFREATILRFVTIISGSGFYVTGTVTSTGLTYPKLVEAFDRDFGSLRGRLPSLPNSQPDAV